MFSSTASLASENSENKTQSSAKKITCTEFQETCIGLIQQSSFISKKKSDQEFSFSDLLESTEKTRSSLQVELEKQTQEKRIGFDLLNSIFSSAEDDGCIMKRER